MTAPPGSSGTDAAQRGVGPGAGCATMEVVSRRVSSERFVGRSLQLDLLSGVLERATQGRPSFAFVGGESGVGKTRLLREFESRAVASGARVLLGQCLELGGAQIPYAPLVGALRPLARSLDAEESEQLPEGTRNALSELLPELGGAETRADDEPSARQGRLFEALLALLERLGRSGPVLLAIEDLHWADSSTRDFLTFLVRSAREERLCLVVTYRSDELHRRHPLRPLLAELEHAAGVERITLERFDRGELAEQLEGILQEPASAALAERLYGRSQGNPLFTEELLAATEDGDGWGLPETLRGVLLARVERLAPATQAVVRAAAVLDRPITHGLLEAVAGLPPAEVMDGAREAVAHQVLVTGSDGLYAFRHALVGEAVHNDLLPGEDTALHFRIAEALEQRPDLLGDVSAATVAAELACHLSAAHELSRSLAASVRAGIAAKRVYAYEEAGRQFERALELWARVPDAEERAGVDRAELLRLAATAASARGEASRSVALIREAIAALDAGAHPERAAALYLRLGHSLRQAGAGSESFAAFDRAVELLPPGPSAERARVLEERSRVEMLLGDYEKTLATVTQALAEARAAGAELTEVRALITLGFTHAGLGDEAEGIATMREGYDRAGAIASPADRGRAAANLSELLDLAGRTEEGLALARAELAEARKRPERTSLRRLPRRPGGLPAHAAGAARRGPRAAARADPGRGDLLRRHLLALHARTARAAQRRPRRDRGGAREAVPPERIGGRAAVDRAAHGDRGRARAARGPAGRRARRRAARRPAHRARRRGDAAAADGLDGAARGGRRGGPRAGARRALRAGAGRGGRRAARARGGAAAVRRGVRLGRDGRGRAGAAPHAAG